MKQQDTLFELDGFLAEKSSSMDKSSAAADDNSDRGTELSEGYSLAGLNIEGNVPLEKIVAAVKRFRNGEHRAGIDRPRLNILLTGVPGGGKTAFVRYLAREVGAQLHIVRASDLLSMWIGESEKNIAKAFKAAKKENAILFLDEVDSFLQDRTGASHAWEVTQVNELLQQMEDFSGVMVGATNFGINLDKAVLRRFTFKLKLDYLTDEGKRIFFRRYFKSDLSDAEQSRLDAIDRLAPGDFRTVSEELYYLCEHETNAERLNALQRESEAKGRARAKIGF